MRLIACLLALCMLCCAACGKKESAPQKTVEDTRDTLVEHEWNGLRFYLGKDFSKTGETASSITYTNGLMDFELTTWALSEFEDNANSSQKFANQYVHILQDQLESETQPETEPRELNVEIGHDNGIYYAIIHHELEYEIGGFYVDSNYGWMASIRCENFETYRDNILNYLTIAKIVGVFDLSTASNISK